MLQLVVLKCIKILLLTQSGEPCKRAFQGCAFHTQTWYYYYYFNNESVYLWNICKNPTHKTDQSIKDLSVWLEGQVYESHVFHQWICVSSHPVLFKFEPKAQMINIDHHFMKMAKIHKMITNMFGRWATRASQSSKSMDLTTEQLSVKLWKAEQSCALRW